MGQVARDQGVYSTSRRSFCRASAVVLIAPGIAIAQGSTPVRRIGVLGPGAPAPSEWLSKQAEPLRALGWVEGQNLHVERRYANGRPEALQPLAEELVRAKVEIIETTGTPATLAAKRATTTIPIVFHGVGDAVLLGLVASLARPSGNVTGLSEAGPEATAKYLSVLKELLPRLQRIGFLWEVLNPYYRAVRGQLEHVCQSLGLAPIIVELGAAGEIDGAIAQLVQRRAEAVGLEGTFVWQHRFAIVDAATKNRLPTAADEAAMVREAAALIAYSNLQAEAYRIRAEYIDRILRGAKPADLPVQQPTKFELVINLKTARALGLTVPKDLLLRADEVIQ